MQRPRAGCKPRLRADLRVECGSNRVDAVIAGRCIGPGSRIERRAVRSVQDSLARLLRTRRHVVSGDRKVMRNAHVLRINHSAQTPRRLCCRSMTSERSPSLRMNAGPGSDGLAPVKDITPAAVDCLSCPVCARTRSSSPSTPLAPWKRRMLFVWRSCTGRVPVLTHPRDFRDLADSKVRRRVRRKAIRLAGILLAYFLGVIRAVAPADGRRRLFHDSPGATRVGRRGATAGLHAQGDEPLR